MILGPMGGVCSAPPPPATLPMDPLSRGGHGHLMLGDKVRTAVYVPGGWIHREQHRVKAAGLSGRECSVPWEEC